MIFSKFLIPRLKINLIYCLSPTIWRLPIHLYFILMLRPRFCRDCGRPIGLATNIRPARCSACRISRLETPIETRPCSGCGIAIPASSLARCGTCRQASRLQNPPKPRQRQGDTCLSSLWQYICRSQRLYPLCRLQGFTAL